MAAYVLHEDLAGFGMPARYRIYEFKTRRGAAEWLSIFKSDQESFKKIVQERGYCPLAIHTTYERAHMIAPALVKKMIAAARAAYPRQAEYIGLRDTCNTRESEPARAAFLY